MVVRRPWWVGYPHITDRRPHQLPCPSIALLTGGMPSRCAVNLAPPTNHLIERPCAPTDLDGHHGVRLCPCILLYNRWELWPLTSNWCWMRPTSTTIVVLVLSSLAMSLLQPSHVVVLRSHCSYHKLHIRYKVIAPHGASIRYAAIVCDWVDDYRRPMSLIILLLIASYR